MTDDERHREAMERFTMAESYDRHNREQAVDDLMFVAGPGQWSDEDRLARKGRPCLTVNQLPQFVAQVVGESRRNPPSIHVRAAEDGDKDVAEVRSGLIRAIESRSDAQGAYLQAADHQVTCGQGNLRVAVDWADDGGFDQEIFIKAVPGPLSVVWDPLSTDRTGADAEYCFVIDEMPKAEFEQRFKGEPLTSFDYGRVNDTSAVIDGVWTTKDTVRVAEYWFIKRKSVTLYRDDAGRVIDVSDQPKDVLDMLPPDSVRKSVRKSVCRRLMSGSKFLDKPYELPIDRLPVVRVVGRITDTGTVRYREGLIRQAKDPCRLQNYWRSVAAEVLALQPRAVWLADQAALDGREDDFRAAAMSGDPLLVKNNAGTVQRVDPPAFPGGLHQEAQINRDDMKAVTGIYDSSMGARSNETSGKAILAREEQGDVATYIFPDNLRASVRAVGDIVNQLIPVIYDTPRTIRILGDDASTKIKRVNDPNDPDAVDLLRGKYDVVVDTGPAYATRRQQAAESMMQFVQAMPASAALVADLIAQAQDWPMAEQLAKRLKAALPPGVGADEEEEPQPPNPAQQQQMQAQQMQMQMAQAKAQADIEKAQAEAMEAKADAVKAQAEAAMAQMQLAAMQQGFVPSMAPMDYDAQGQGAPSF